MRLLQRLPSLLVLALAAINPLLAGAKGHSFPSIEFQQFKLIDGFPYAEFSLLNPTDSSFWFLAEGQEPAYMLEVRTRKMNWQDASPGQCGLTQFRRVELSPRGSSSSFLVELPVLVSVFRIKVPIYRSQNSPEQQIASPPVTAPADLVRPSVQGFVVPPDELEAPKPLARLVPEYPGIAMRARIEGTVILRVVVGPSGAVENVQVMKGEAVLATAAVKAVKSWRYSPIVWRGEPASAILTEKVVFRLEHN